jgi:L-ascorbate metabolism protein UlaG (beta-lactamase superfamily)
MVTATTAVYDGLRMFGPLAEAVGYVVDSPPRRVYFAGDTDPFTETKD